MNSTPLRIGLLVNSLDLPAWNHEVLEEINKSAWGEVALIVRNASPSKKRSFGQRLRGFGNNFFWSVFTRFDEWKTRAECQPNAFETSSIEHLVSGVPILDTLPQQTAFSDRVCEEDLSEIQKAEIDVLLRWGFRILRGEILQAANHGIWSFHHGDNRVNRGTMPGFWEVMRGDATTGSVLQVLSEQLDAGIIIDRHFGQTDTTSVARNRHNLYWKTAPMLTTNLRKLHEEGPDFLERKKNDRSLQAYCEPLRTQPTNLEALAAISRVASNFFIGEKARNLIEFEQWGLSFRIRKRADDPNLAFYQYTVIQPPKDVIWADPFVIERNDRYYVFVEEMPIATEHGHISVLEIDRDGKWSTAKPVIKQPYHMSYPFLFEHDDELWMIPETGENRTVELYRCVEFPHEWKLETTLMENVRAADATLHYHEDRWWMFVSMGRKNLQNIDALHLFHAAKIQGPWVPHPENPISRDVRTARSGGRLFEAEGKLYRPAQDSSERYGGAIRINEVLELNEQTFREQTATTITPNWSPRVLGTHTINSAGDITVIDTELRRSRFFS